MLDKGDSVKILSIRFWKEVRLGRDQERISLIQGQELRGPAFPDGVTVRMAFVGEAFVGVMLEPMTKSGLTKPSARLFGSSNIQDVEVEPEDLEYAMMLSEDERKGKKR